MVIVEQRETGNSASGQSGGFCNASLIHGFVNGYTRFPDEITVIQKARVSKFFAETFK